MESKRTTWLWLLVVVATFALTATAFGGEAAKSNGSKEGIKVHGHWKIEISNPDGTRASVTEFDNALQAEPGSATGLQLLSYLLTGRWVFGAWYIALRNTSGNNPCDCPNQSDLTCGCEIGEAGANYGSHTPFIQSFTLQVSVTPTLSIVLTGDAVATNDTTIDEALTYIVCCDPLLTTTDCRNNLSYFRSFTGKVLSTPPSVVSGQLIQVTVEISFS